MPPAVKGSKLPPNVLPSTKIHEAQPKVTQEDSFHSSLSLSLLTLISGLWVLPFPFSQSEPATITISLSRQGS